MDRLSQLFPSEPIAILYEHAEWFKPLFAELERRGIAYERLHAEEHHFNPEANTERWRLVVNRVSPSSYLRGHGQAMFYAQQFLQHVEALGIPVVNGSRAYALELSKASQLVLLHRLGIPHPASRVLNHASQLVAAASELAYPVIVKPNVGGSGALMRRFDGEGELRAAVEAGELDALFEIDHTALIQEYHPQKGGSIVRVEVLDGKLLYAIRIQNDPRQGFNLCPADICQAPQASDFDACPVDAAPARKIEATQAPKWVLDDVLRICRAAEIDVGGVEYLESERDGQIYLYDVNALSNFVGDAPRIVGFDPFVPFVDYLLKRAGITEREMAAA